MVSGFTFQLSFSQNQCHGATDLGITCWTLYIKLIIKIEIRKNISKRMPSLEFICLLGLLWVEFIKDTNKLQESYLRRYNFDIFAQSTFRQLFGFRRKCHLMFCAQLWRSHHWESLSARRRMVLHRQRNNQNHHHYHHQHHHRIVIVIIVFVII